MPGVLLASPADVIAALLVDLGVGGDAAADPLPGWPAYVGSEPSGPDECLTLYDVAGRDFGRSMVTGDRCEHHGFQLRVRARTHAAGYAKARAAAVAFDRDVFRRAVALGGRAYCVHSVTRTSDVLALGKEVPATKRSLFTVNGTAYILML
jgi:hypothetical protein